MGQGFKNQVWFDSFEAGQIATVAFSFAIARAGTTIQCHFHNTAAGKAGEISELLNRGAEEGQHGSAHGFSHVQQAAVVGQNQGAFSQEACHFNERTVLDDFHLLVLGSDHGQAAFGEPANFLWTDKDAHGSIIFLANVLHDIRKVFFRPALAVPLSTGGEAQRGRGIGIQNFQSGERSRKFRRQGCDQGIKQGIETLAHGGVQLAVAFAQAEQSQAGGGVFFELYDGAPAHEHQQEVAAQDIVGIDNGVEFLAAQKNSQLAQLVDPASGQSNNAVDAVHVFHERGEGGFGHQCDLAAGRLLALGKTRQGPGQQAQVSEGSKTDDEDLLQNGLTFGEKLFSDYIMGYLPLWENVFLRMIAQGGSGQLWF